MKQKSARTKKKQNVQKNPKLYIEPNVQKKYNYIHRTKKNRTKCTEKNHNYIYTQSVQCVVSVYCMFFSAKKGVIGYNNIIFYEGYWIRILGG